MRALVYHGPGTKGLGGGAATGHHRRHRRHRAGRRRDHLRHRPAHPQGRRARGDRRPHPRPRGGRHRRGGRRRRQERHGRRPRPRLVHHRVRRVPVLPRGPLRAVPRRRRLDPRAPDRRHAGRVRAGAVRRHLDVPGAGRRQRRGGADARRHPARPATRSGCSTAPCGPGDVVAVVGAGPIGLSAIMGARLFSPAPRRGDRPGRRPARGGQAVRRRRHRQQLSREDALAVVRELTDGLGADVAIEAVGVPATFELCARAGAARRARRQRRRPRRAGDPAPGGPVDPGRHHHHRPGRHLLHADAAHARHERPGRRRAGSSPTGSPCDEFMQAYDVFSRRR